MKILFLPILCVLLMIGIIIFEQTTMEIYAYGYVINRNTREKDLNEKKVNQKIYKKKIKSKSNNTSKKNLIDSTNDKLKKSSVLFFIKPV